MFALGRRISNLAKPFLNLRRSFQVSVIGASQPLGQSVSLLLKQHPLVHRLSMYGAPDETYGVPIPREASIDERMKLALKCSEIVVVACGQPTKPGQTEQDHFKQNADSVIHAMQKIAAHCPFAFVVIATEPINQTVPLAAKVLGSGDCYDKCRVFGVTGLDTMRAQSWVGGMYQIQPRYLSVPVICGHSPKTMVPLFSHIKPRFGINNCAARFMTENIRNTDNHVADLKGGNKESTLSAAFATFCTVSGILNAMNGYAIEHVAFVANNDFGTKFFAAPVIINRQGITALMRYKMFSALEADYIKQSSEQLSHDVNEGESYFNPDIHYQSTTKENINLQYIKTL